MKTIASLSDPGSLIDAIPIRVSTECMRAHLAPHYHDYTQICYSLSGSLVHTIDGKQYKQSHGSCAFIPPFTVHSLDSTESEDTPVSIFITFLDNNFTRFGYDYFSYHNIYANFEGMKIPHFAHFKGKTRQYTDSVVREMSNESYKHSDMSHEHIAELLSRLLRTICESVSQAKPISLKADVRSRAESIHRAVRYIGEHYREKISVDMLAEVASMSRRTFLRTFREITGHTTNEILTSRRINASIYHINFTEKSLSEIAQEVGLYDKSRLSKLFYEYHGVTPTEYRQITHSTANRANYLHKMRWAWLGTDMPSENDL